MYVVVRGLRPPSRSIEKDGVDLLSVSVSWIGESPVVLCIWRLLGTVDNSRYPRCVGIPFPAIFRTHITVWKSLLSMF